MNERPVTGKALCFTVGLYVSLLYSIYGPRCGLLLAVALGILKEVHDKADYGYYDWHDTVATSAGGFAGYIIANILSFIF